MAFQMLYQQETKPNDWKPTRTPMRNPSELAKEYGLTYDANEIQAKFDNATRAQYDALRKEYTATENKYYNDMYANQQTSLDAIRKANAQAVATGASRGMQAANELSTILGAQQEGVAGATQLAVDKNLLHDKEQAAYAKNAQDALTQANQTGLALGNLNNNIYATDTQFDVGQMDYYARMDQALKQLMGMQEQANATAYNADKNLEGNKYTADKNLEGNRYTADKNLEGNKYTADKNYAGTVYNADKNYAGTVYSANKSGSYYNNQQEPKDLATVLRGYAMNGDKDAYITMLVSNGWDAKAAQQAWASNNVQTVYPANSMSKLPGSYPNNSSSGKPWSGDSTQKWFSTAGKYVTGDRNKRRK